MPRKRRDRRDGREIWSPALLVCEGSDDCFFMDSLRVLMGIDETRIQIETFGPADDDGGKDWMPEFLGVLEARPGFSQLRALGIVRDGDTNASGAFDSVVGHLTSNQFAAPSRHGDVQASSHPRVDQLSIGIFIMPDGMSDGAWEELYLASVREQSSLTNDHGIACADAFVNCFDPSHSLATARREKMRLYAWLSTRERPSARPAQALFWRYVDGQSDVFKPIREFLAQLAAAAALPDQPPE